MIINKHFEIIPGSLNSFVNPFSFMELMKLDGRSALLPRFNLYMDGISLVWTARAAGWQKDCERFSFDDTSIAPLVFEHARRNNLKIGIAGSKREIIENTVGLLTNKYQVNVIASHDGYFPPESMKDVARHFLQCDLVICSMGTPRQEQFLICLQDLGWKGTGFTCGGFFDQLNEAGGADYYPPLIDRFNLRWAYRIYREPRRLWRRYFLQYPQGLLHFFFSILLRQTRLR